MVGSDMETFGEDTFTSNLPCVCYEVICLHLREKLM